MDPISAGIMAGALLGGSLFGQAHQRREQRATMEFEGTMRGLEQKKLGQQMMGEAVQGGGENLMDVYRQAFL